jgi:hypothetical protein
VAHRVGRLLGGVLLAFLPARHWARWDLPAAPLALVSAASTVAAGCLLGLDGYLRYAGRVGEILAPLSGETGDGIFSVGMGMSALSLPTFALFTPLGLLCTYLVLSGIARVTMVLAGTPGGDPVLALADGWLHGRRRDRARETAAADRAALEGPEVADILTPGSELGFPDAEWVVVASRVKPGWQPGVIVVTTDRWWRIGAACDRRRPEGLRALYPLHAVAAAEVIRRSVYYDHPQLSALAAATDAPAPAP